jgi:hypothetical protein
MPACRRPPVLLMTTCLVVGVPPSAVSLTLHLLITASLTHLHPPLLPVQVLHLNQGESTRPPGGTTQQRGGQALGGHFLVELTVEQQQAAA